MLTSNNFTKGINRDIHPKYQEEGTYRYAFNAVLETREGDIPSISNELGTELCASFPDDKHIIGHALTDTSDIVVFLYHNDSSRPYHEIGIYDPIQCTYTTIVKDQLLNFSWEHPINAIVRIKNGCDRYLYFTDNYNPYRVVNITDTSEWVNPTYLSLIDASKIELTRDYGKHPNVQLAGAEFVLAGGGQIDYGAYSFYFRYLDENENPTVEWLPLTGYIGVGAGTQSNSNSALIVGADNVDSSPNYRPKANKNIRFNITDINTIFKYYQIAVIKRTTLGGAVSEVNILNPIPIEDASSVFIYTGFDTQIESVTSLDDILTPRQRIDKVTAHVLDDNRLFLAGHTKDARDYAGYQRAASAVKVTYIASNIDDRTSTVSTNHVFPITMPHDEVVPLGIVYVHADGDISPVFPLVGRPANISEIDGDHYNPYVVSPTNWDTDDITGDTNIFNSLKTKRWQVYSTATIDTTTSDNEGWVGHLGYHETETTYPEITSCDNHDDGYWGRDWDGNLIEAGVTKIRHFRMPAQWLYNQAQTDDFADYAQYKINLVMTNVQLPADDIVSYFFVYGDDASEKTILDRGYLGPMSWDPNDETYYYSYNDWKSVVFKVSADKADMVHTAFVSPQTLYDNLPSEGAYISIEKQLRDGLASISTQDTGTLTVTEFSASLNTHTYICNYDTFKLPENRLNYTIEASNYIRRRSPQAGDSGGPMNSNPVFSLGTTLDRVENRSAQTNILHLELDAYLEEIDAVTLSGAGVTTSAPEVKYRHLLATVKVDRDVHNNLFQIKYKRLNPLNYDYSDSDVFTIDGGNRFIPYVDVNDFFWTSGDLYAHHTTTPIVHELNTGFRYFSQADRGLYTFYQHDDGYSHDAYVKYFVSKYYEIAEDQPLFYQEYYSLNPAYNYIGVDNIYFPIPFNYQACNDCIESSPYRVYYSEQDFSEDTTDKLRIFFSNNYKDVNADTGPITDIFKSFDQVYLTTLHKPYLVPTKPQTINSNENGIFIDTGEVLSLPFRQLTSPDFALGGMRHFKHKVTTEFGVAYVDDLSGRPILLTNQPNDITNGDRNFWEENGPLQLLKQFKYVTGLDYPIVSTAAPTGVGYSLAYDPRYKRLIVHKKDYKIKPEYQSGFVYSPDVSINTAGVLWYNGVDYYFNRTSTSIQKVTFNDPTFFENHSFTYSYSFLTNHWVSFHSYQPDYLMNDYDTFYSNGTWKHNYGDPQTYYGEKDIHIVDLIAVQNPQEIKYGTNIFYNSRVDEYDSNLREYYPVDKTYTGLVAYNSYQTTGYQDLTYINDSGYFIFDFSSNQALVRKTDNKFKINDLRDLTLNHTSPIWSRNPDDMSLTPFVDKVPNPANINYSKSLFELPRLRDNYLGVRFYYDSPTNTRITTDIVNTQYANRNR